MIISGGRLPLMIDWLYPICPGLVVGWGNPAKPFGSAQVPP